MAVTVADVRLASGDTGRQYPPQNEGPVNIGQSDGMTTLLFALPHATIDPSSLQVFIWNQPVGPGQPLLPVLQDPSAYIFSGPPALIAFPKPPQGGATIAARYSIVGFSDAAILTLIARCTAQGFTDDPSLLAACAHFLIGAMLANEDRMKTIHQERFTDDKNALVKSLVKLREDLAVEMRGGILAGQDAPAYSFGTTPLQPYQTRNI